MEHIAPHAFGNTLKFAGADLEVRAQMGQQCLTIEVMKSGACVHRVTVNDVTGPLEHGWIAHLFAGERATNMLATLAPPLPS